MTCAGVPCGFMSSGVSVSSLVWASNTRAVCLFKFNLFSAAAALLVGFTELTDKADLFPPRMTSSHSARELPGQTLICEVQWKPKPLEGLARSGGGVGPRMCTTDTHLMCSWHLRNHKQ